MADYDFSTDPDFPADPEAAARLGEQLHEMAATLPPTYWHAVQLLLHTAGLLHGSLWRQPALNSLPAAITELTGLTRQDADDLRHLPSPLVLMTEVTLRGGRLYYYALAARYLLDTPLGSFALRMRLSPTERYQVAEELVQPLVASMVVAFEQWLTQLWVRAGAELTELEPNLLRAQLASTVLHASEHPGRFFDANVREEFLPWPAPPVGDEETREFHLPAGIHRYLRLGASCLLMAGYKLTSPWASFLLDQLSPLAVDYLRTVSDESLRGLDEQELRVGLTLAAATDLHWTASLAGVMTASAAWDELAALTFERNQPAPAPEVSLAAVLPAGVSLPAAEPAPSLRHDVGLVMRGIVEEIENMFGADTAPLAANRVLAARLAELG